MKNISLFILSFICSLALQAQQVNKNTLRTGDLLFQNLDCGAMCDAIEAVTIGWNNHSFSHVGLVERIDNAIYVWESSGSDVRKVLFDSFQHRSKNPLVLGRLKNRYSKLIPNAIQFIHKNDGVAYDDDFLYDNGKYYCLELIYNAFLFANKNKPFFKLYPMTFKKPGSTNYFPVWVDYFKQLKKQIPEGKPGCNPGGLSRSDKIFIIGILN